MLLCLSGHCGSSSHLWIDWQGPQHPGDLGDAHSLVIGQTALPNQFAHQYRPVALAPSLPVTVTGWLAFDTGHQVQRASSCPGLNPLAKA